MFCELVQPDLIHVTADDMPGGADIQLHDRGFRFTPYLVAVNYRGLTVCPKCCDENTSMSAASSMTSSRSTSGACVLRRCALVLSTAMRSPTQRWS